MDDTLSQIAAQLQMLIGLHGRLLDVVRSEREALIHADLHALEKSTEIKHGILEDIRRAESERLKKVGQWAARSRQDPQRLTLNHMILNIQSTHPQMADRLRSLSQTLNLLIHRIQSQSQEIKALIQRSLVHIHEMKRNALKESHPSAATYTSQGQRTHGASHAMGSRLISTEG